MRLVLVSFTVIYSCIIIPLYETRDEMPAQWPRLVRLVVENVDNSFTACLRLVLPCAPQTAA